MISLDGSRNGCLSGADVWRDNKVITPPQEPVIISHFGLKIARLDITDNIFLTILEKKENLPELKKLLPPYYSLFPH
jgi:hypothetical protein